MVIKKIVEYSNIDDMLHIISNAPLEPYRAINNDGEYCQSVNKGEDFVGINKELSDSNEMISVFKEGSTVPCEIDENQVIVKGDDLGIGTDGKLIKVITSEYTIANAMYDVTTGAGETSIIPVYITKYESKSKLIKYNTFYYSWNGIRDNAYLATDFITGDYLNGSYVKSNAKIKQIYGYTELGNLTKGIEIHRWDGATLTTIDSFNLVNRTYNQLKDITIYQGDKISCFIVAAGTLIRNPQIWLDIVFD